ncbi:DUF1659 domain-containing protein [Rossellomorea vietnamensis]|uniref:DUF1659 domain-containing protein n=1 Tax=Rossellomorea vietnamensis TaxID=218284 RepID=A0A5D4LX40_9BACI|nr:DUF1659 domain-containing protein [Rossellomorea vietnamensis]TYR94294.1 DUF1659 domain-containing protein [Rossellomorea vietnamensis]
MATSDLKSIKLRMVYDNGVDENGKPKYSNKTYANINYTSTPDEILQAAQALAGLSSRPLLLVEKNDSYDINE